MVMKKGNDQKQNAEKRKNRMTALLMALILCVGMVSGTNKEVRAQSASQNSETQTASESDVTTENTANIAGNTTKSAATVTHYEYTTEEVKETIQGIFEWAKSLTNADELIDKTFLEGADTSLNDWFAFAAARSGYKEDYKSYRKAMETAIAKKYGTKKEKLGKATEYQRAALVIAALGGDPQAVSDMAGEKTINLIADGTYNRGKTEPLDTQGTNALIWALIALDSGDYEVPEDAYQSREEILAELLKAQESDGGFSLSAGSGQTDVDITAMALTALAPYYEENSEAKAAADLALSWISEHQESDGGFCSSMDTGTESSESCAQVLTALCSLGIDPQSDSRFIKNGNTVLDNLMSFRQEDGGFVHAYVYDASNPASIPDESDFLAGGQAAYALTAFCRYKNNMKNLFNLRPEKASLLSKNGSAMPVMVMLILPVAFTGALFALPLTGRDLSILALVSIIMLAGTVVNSSIILVEYIKIRRSKGESREEAILHNHDIANDSVIFERMENRVKIAETDIGKELKHQADDLRRLLVAYRSGAVTEDHKE